MKRVLLIFISLLLYNSLFSQFDEVWKKISTNDYDKASDLLLELSAKPETTVDASLILLLLNELEGGVSEKESLLLMKNVVNNSKDVSPYLFALWYTDAVTSSMGLKSDNRLSYLSELRQSNKVNASMKASIDYATALHYTLLYDIKNKKKYFNSIGAIRKWQYTGVFDNTSGSGFDNGSKQLLNPKPTAKFLSKKNASVTWFVPTVEDYDPWGTFENMMPETQGVIFAQSFISNPLEQEVLVKLGGEGSIKLWINDKLIISEEEEQRTELDYYSAQITLPKGNNRVLIQISHTAKSDYPNFILRFLNVVNGKPINNIKSSNIYSEYNSAESVKITKKDIPHFAEEYFRQQIKKDSSNLVNYLLLAKCYDRAKKNNENVKIIELGKKIDPKNILLNIDLLISYQKINDRTALMLQLDKLRELNPDLLLLHSYDFTTALEKENYTDAEVALDKLGLIIGKDNPSYMSSEIELLSAKNEYQELFILIDKAYLKYPNYTKFVEFKFLLEKNRTQSGLKAIPILKKYLKKKYNYNIQKILISEYQEIGLKDKALKLLYQSIEQFPAELDYLNQVLLIKYNQGNYTESLQIINKMISISPYNSELYVSKAYILLALNKETEAKANFNHAIKFNPNSFESREKLRMLNGKKSWTEITENANGYDIIKESFNSEGESDDKYDFVFYEKSDIKFEEGAGVEFISVGIRILNKAGIDAWKEMTIPYNYNSEYLIVTKAEINKSNGQKLDGERNYSQIVFTNLEVGDIIYLEYRKDIYTWGKLAQEISKTYSFSNFVTTHNSLYRIYVPKSFIVNFKEQNLTADKKEFNFEEFVCTEYSHTRIEKVKEENFMPKITEVGETVYISTIDNWETISNWYKDLAIPMAREDYNVEQVYAEIFSSNQDLSDQEKAIKIYNYLCENISYSSVSFRQSNFVPQKPMVTLSTKLGDCKDLSTLYYTLANKAGLTTHLVLVNTVDNGINTMQIPSVAFNHCIIRIELEGDTIYQELTDNKLPFGTLPSHLSNAQALVIYDDEKLNYNSSLIHIPREKSLKNKINRKVQISMEGDKINLSTDLKLVGEEASSYRWKLTGLTEAETKKSIGEYGSSFFDGDVKIIDYDIKNLDSINSFFQLSIEMELEDEIKSIGSLSTFSIPFFEKIFSIDKFPNEDRNYNLNYWAYETIDEYSTSVNIKITEQQEYVEIPENIEIKNDFLIFTITINKISETELEIRRYVKPLKLLISKDEYKEFRETVKEISKYEDTFIAFKDKE